MNIANTANGRSEPSKVESALLGLQRLMRAPAQQKFFSVLLFLNLFVLMVRPQDMVPIIAKTKITIPLSLLMLLVVPSRFQALFQRSRVVQAMCALLLICAVWVPLAVNNGWAFNNFRDLLQQFFCFMFPVMMLCFYGNRLRQLGTFFALSGLMIGLWAVTHGGRGPGGFLGDENDLCLALNSMLGIPLLLVTSKVSSAKRVFFAFAVLAMLAAAVISASRGGFIGLVCLLGYTYYKSPRKLAMTVVGIVIGIIGLLSVPGNYWSEMSTITDTKESTADERMDTWSIIYNMWTDPKNFVFGVGTGNTRWRMGEYEPKSNRAAHGKSLAGRAAHSSFFQLMGDLGAAGLFLVGLMLAISFFGNTRLMRKLKKTERYLKKRVSALSARRKEEPGEEMLSLQRGIGSSISHIHFLRAFGTGLNASLLGVAGAGFFISALYYPPIWLLISISVALQYHIRLFVRQLGELDALVDTIAVDTNADELADNLA